MIDWHSHILPAVDDGSRSLDESVQMLKSLKAQGVDTVIATPHFWASEESVESFLARREKAYCELSEKARELDMELLCGAEVRYYPGISRMEGLSRLAIGDTSLLLLEMPMSRFTDLVVRELTELASTRGLKIVMAHIERYFGYMKKDTVETLCANGLLMQSNASFFTRFGVRAKAVKLLSNGQIHFIGSDCHNMTTRAPHIREAYEVIEKKLSEDFVFQMVEYGYRTLKKSKIHR